MTIDQSLMLSFLLKLKWNLEFDYRFQTIPQFWCACFRGILRSSLWRALNKESHLQDLTDAMKGTCLINGYTLRVQSVPLNHVRGSDVRSGDFDDEFHPIKLHVMERWIRVASVMQSSLPFPPIELIQIGERFCAGWAPPSFTCTRVSLDVYRSNRNRMASGADETVAEDWCLIS